MASAGQLIGGLVDAAKGKDDIKSRAQRATGAGGLTGQFDGAASKVNSVTRKLTDGDAEYVVKGQRQDEYYRLEKKKDGTFKTIPYNQNEITQEEIARSKTLPEMQQELKAANTPSSLSVSLSRMQKIDAIIAEKTGRTRDTDLDDNLATLQQTTRTETIPAKGKVKARTTEVAIDHTNDVIQTRRELIGEFQQRLDELGDIKKKDLPNKSDLETAVKDEIKTLKQADELPQALDSFTQFMAAQTAAPAVAAPAAKAPAPKGPNPLD